MLSYRVYLLPAVLTGFLLAGSAGAGQLHSIGAVHMATPPGDKEDAILSVAFSPDGKHLASSDQRGRVTLWDVSTGKQIRAFQGNTSRVRSIALSPDGKVLASGAADKIIRLWNVASGKELRSWQTEHGALESVAFSPDGKTLASGSSERMIQLWEVTSGKEIRSFAGHQKRVTAVVFSPTGKMLASAGTDRTVRLWDVATGKEVRPLPRPAGWVNAVVFSADGKLLAAGGRDQQIHVLRPATGVRVHTIDTEHGVIEALAFSPDGRTVATGCPDHTIRLWEVATGHLRLERDMPQGPVYAVAFAPDGTRLAAGGRGNHLLVWDVTGGASKGQTPKTPPSARQLEEWESALPGADGERAYQAQWQLAGRHRQAVPFLKEQLKPLFQMSEQIARWIVDLDNRQFAVRERATRQLEQVGELGEPLIKRLVTEKPSLEARRRVDNILAKVDRQRPPKGPSQQWRVLRIIEVLEWIGTRDARELLESLAAKAPDAELQAEAKASLERLAKR